MLALSAFFIDWFSGTAFLWASAGFAAMLCAGTSDRVARCSFRVLLGLCVAASLANLLPGLGGSLLSATVLTALLRRCCDAGWAETLLVASVSRVGAMGTSLLLMPMVILER